MSLTLVNRKPRYTADQVVRWQANRDQSRQAMDQFQNVMARIGVGTNNLLEGTQYPLTRLSRNYILMQSLYRNNWIVRKVIDGIAEDMLKNGTKLVLDLDPKQISRFTKTLQDTGTVNQMLTAMKWGRLFGGAGALIVIDGDESRLDEPLELDDVLPGTYRGLIPFDRWSGITPDSNISNDTSRPLEYGLPENYRVTTETGQGFNVHASRIIRFIGRDLPIWEKQAEVYWGISEVEVFYEELKKRDNTSWNIASLVFRANIFALKTKDLAQMLSGLGSSSMVQQRFNASLQAMTALMSNQGLLVLPEDGGIETHQYAFAGVSDVYEQFKQDICGATEYPYSRLFGKPSGGMGTTNEGDEHSYYDMVSQKQKRELDPQLKKLYPIVAMSTWGEVPDDLEWIYNPVRSMSNEEQAELGAKRTTAVVEVFNAGIIGQKTALKELKQVSDETNLFSNITDKMIADASDEVVSPMDELAAQTAPPGGGPAKGEGGANPKGTGEIPATPNSNPKKARDSAMEKFTFAGLPIVVENPTGSTRSGTGHGGVPWAVEMTRDYGYINRTEGTDGDAVDVFLGPLEECTQAYVIHAQNPLTGEYDEDKVMLGFRSLSAAREAFMENYSSGMFFGTMEAIPMAEFKTKLKTLRGRKLTASVSA